MEKTAVFLAFLALMGAVAPFAYSKSDPNPNCTNEKLSGKIVAIDQAERTMKIQIRAGRTPIRKTVMIDSQVSEAELQSIHQADYVKIEVLECWSRVATKIERVG